MKKVFLILVSLIFIGGGVVEGQNVKQTNYDETNGVYSKCTCESKADKYSNLVWKFIEKENGNFEFVSSEVVLEIDWRRELMWIGHDEVRIKFPPMDIVKMRQEVLIVDEKDDFKRVDIVYDKMGKIVGIEFGE